MPISTSIWRKLTTQAFFTEWQQTLPSLSAADFEFLDRLKTRYRYYQADGAMTESTANLILVAPLLEYLAFCDPPYKIAGEKYVKIEIEDGDLKTKVWPASHLPQSEEILGLQFLKWLSNCRQIG